MKVISIYDIIAIICVVRLVHIALDWLLKVFKYLLKDYKEGICPACMDCRFFKLSDCKGLTEWFKEDCDIKRKRAGLK